MKPSFRHLAMAMLVPAAMAGCTTYGPGALTPGATMSEVTASLGQPTGRYARPGGGERVEYARGPYGKHTFMLDFDAQGHLGSWQQVLNEPNFDAVRNGLSRDELLFALGHPAEQRPLTFQNRMLWSYRYDAPFCKWFQVGLDASGRVVDTGYGPDPLCSDYMTIGDR